MFNENKIRWKMFYLYQVILLFISFVNNRNVLNTVRFLKCWLDTYLQQINIKTNVLKKTMGNLGSRINVKY
jgi:hypothetical protein